MPTYTFITDYRGGTYITQKTAPDLQEALVFWQQEIASSGYVAHLDTAVFLRKFEESAEAFPPANIDTVSNVWLFHLLMGRYMMDVHIIQTEMAANGTHRSDPAASQGNAVA